MKLGVADVNVGVLVVFAITSMGVYGIVLAGWSSNSKYSLFGGLRAAAQMISYELSYATALAAVILLAGSLSLREVVDSQAGSWLGVIPRWYVFLQPVGFIIYMVAGVAETNRAPFDFPRRSRSWSPATTPSTARCGSRCSRRPNTSTWPRWRRWQRTCTWAAGTGPFSRRNTAGSGSS